MTDDGGCGVAKQLALLAHEANVLGLANVTLIKDAEKIAKIFLHGAQFEEELYGALSALEQHDARGAGIALGKVLETLAQWTTGKGCSSSDACFVLEGIITLLADGAGSFKQCEADVKETWGNLSAAFKEFDDGKSFWHFKHNRDAIRAGFGDYQRGLAAEDPQAYLVDLYPGAPPGLDGQGPSMNSCFGVHPIADAHARLATMIALDLAAQGGALPPPVQ